MHEFKVLSNQKITSGTILLTLERTPTSKPFTFKPGQYATISFKRKGRPTPVRCFSMINSPTDESHIQFSVRIFGKYTKAVSELQPGETVQLRGPFGGFVIDENRDKEIVMLAGGIGITPLISIIQYACNLKLPNKIDLVYSSKNQEDIPFAVQLRDLSAKNPNLSTNFVVSDGPTDKLTGCTVHSGRVTAEIVKTSTGDSYVGKKFFICGPPQFMHAMTKLLISEGVDAGNIVTESFHGGKNGQPGNIRSWPFYIYLLGALGAAIASAAVMLSDLISNLPNSLLGTSSLVDLSYSNNNRQAELDKLVKGMPASKSSAPATAAAAKAAQPPQASSSSATSSAATPAALPTTATTTTTTTTAPTPIPAPAPKPKVCTTSSTGKVTCT